ncbi:hypothetical protein [Nonomuraea phyllanthi]|uniref:hypothetical protein n=1 Tax=Nonomuraea phyllanthi TaxID=2219224 RepID=UPI0012938079|nr:hypothetical protein [Nonomuraea phyllanthi]
MSRIHAAADPQKLTRFGEPAKLGRLGRDAGARTAYRRALGLATSTSERRFLTHWLEQL